MLQMDGFRATERRPEEPPLTITLLDDIAFINDIDLRMAEYGNMENTSDFDRETTITLYNSQMKGTEDLYLRIGYFFRMRFWDYINKRSLYIKSASESHQYQDIYNTCMRLMNRYIENSQGKISMENMNNMIFNRNMIKAEFANDHKGFVENLGKCLDKESEIRTTGHINAPDLQQPNLSTFEYPMDIVKGEIQEDSDINGMDCNSLVGNISSSLQFDTEFLDELETVCNNMEKERNFRDELKKDIEMKEHKLKDCKTQEQQFALQQQMGIISQRMKSPEQAYESFKKRLLELLENHRPRLEDIRDKYLRHQALMVVKLRPGDEELLGQLTSVFERYARILCKLHNENNSVCSKLEDIIKSFMSMVLIVQQHPSCCIFIQNTKNKKGENTEAVDESKAKGKKQKGEGSKGKAAAVYETKKKTCLNSKIIILGYEYLSKLGLNNLAMTLSTEGGSECGTLSWNHQFQESKISFSDIKICDYKRESKNIRHQLVRLHFSLRANCFDQNFELKTKTLPFYLCTGSLQMHELQGSQMWYIFSNQNMYSDCQMHDELNTDKVLDMLDQHIQSISSSQNTRRLSYDAKQFLLNQILGQQGQQGNSAGTKKKITLHSLVKNSKENGDSVSSKKESFYTWFYAFVNTISKFLLQPWLDGVVYDLMSKEQANQVLLGDTIPPDTALIRPARSYVINPNSNDAEIKLAVEIKTCSNGKDTIHVVLLEMSTVGEIGLSKTLNSILDPEHVPIIKQVLTTKGSISIEKMMEKYPHMEAEDTSSKDEYHKTIVERMTHMKLQIAPRGQSDCSPCKSSRMTPSSQGEFTPIRRKTTSRQTSCSSSINSPQAGPVANSPASSYYSGSPMMSGPSSQQTDVRSPEVMSHGTAFALSPQSLERPDNHDIQDTSAMIPISPSSVASSQENWSECGQTKVNTNNITRHLLNKNQLPPAAAVTNNDGSRGPTNAKIQSWIALSANAVGVLTENSFVTTSLLPKTLNDSEVPVTTTEGALMALDSVSKAHGLYYSNGNGVVSEIPNASFPVVTNTTTFSGHYNRSSMTHSYGSGVSPQNAFQAPNTSTVSAQDAYNFVRSEEMESNPMQQGVEGDGSRGSYSVDRIFMKESSPGVVLSDGNNDCPEMDNGLQSFIIDNCKEQSNVPLDEILTRLQQGQDGV